MKAPLFFLSCLSLISACGPSIDTEHANDHDPCTQRDTITPTGTFVHYVKKEGGTTIHWGDSTYTSELAKVYECNYDSFCGLWDYIPKLQSENKNYLLFTYVGWNSGGCNPACIQASVLLLPKGKAPVFEQELYLTSNEHYLVYFDERAYDSLYAMNLDNNQKQLIVLDPPLLITHRSPMLSVEAKIVGDTLKLNYSSAFDNKEGLIAVEKSIKLDD